ncbi:holo-ACP synthase [Deferribacter thermophilus]|uniref:holo-ACP synthase n=1 Tax=Deferribacter thermophilus TaxID=53573 RepID=UPI003C243C8E
MIGCDIIEIERLKKSYIKYGEKFLDKILSTKEKKIFFTKHLNKYSFLAGRFAAKEAVIKCLDKTIISYNKIEILNDKSGKPFIVIDNSVRDDLKLSISHSRDYAMAVCLKI